MTKQPRTDKPPATPLGGALAWLIHPVTLAATALLLVNDHVLKAALPGLLTGKLSDVAGLIMAPPVLGVMLAVAAPWLRPDARATVAVAAVGAGFTAVKASPPVAAYASTLWSVVNGPSVVLADLTDLAALPAVGLAWWTWRVARRGVDLGRWARLAGVLVVLPLASIAIVATSAPMYPDALTIVEWRGRLVVGIGQAYMQRAREPVRYRVSDDDGLTFRELADDEEATFLADEPTLIQAGGADCSSVRPGHCFRVVSGHLLVEETADAGATWRTSWQISDLERSRLAVNVPELRDITEYLSSRALAVRDQPDGGLVVLVANGRDGFARRGPSGEWSRIGFGALVDPSAQVTYSPDPVPIPDLNPATVPRLMPLPTALAIIVGAGVIGVGLMAAALRSRWRMIGLGALAAVAVGAVPATVGSSTQVLAWELVMAMGIALIIVGVMLATWLSVWKRIVTTSGAIGMGLLGVTAGIGVLAPYVGRMGMGWPPSQVAALVAAVASLAAAAGSILLGLRQSTDRRLVTSDSYEQARHSG
jgi:hypothetical protein